MNKTVGLVGEELALKFLRKKGFKLVEKNFSTRFGEIDLIIRKAGLLVFVEVKTVLVDSAGRPEWRINKKKIDQVQKMAQVYLVTQRPEYTDLRIDVVCVRINDDGQVENINYYQNMTANY
jgi:putative endonuclease